MSKRNQIIKETKESKALKVLRIKADLGIRKLALRMNYSHTRVHQFETGREDINATYIQIFLEATGFKYEDWQKEAGGFKRSLNLRDKCHDLLDRIDTDKLEMLHSLLLSL
jgi:transcriptional regulator with XRE-family HTH domain